MGIIEAIQEERIRQATEEVTEQVTEKVMKESVQKLYKRGFEIEAIAEMLEVPLEFAKESVK